MPSPPQLSGITYFDNHCQNMQASASLNRRTMSLPAAVSGPPPVRFLQLGCNILSLSQWSKLVPNYRSENFLAPLYLPSINHNRSD